MQPSTTDQPSKAELFDYIVIGGGSAGCVLAARLSEDPRTRVLLLEAGPADLHPGLHIPAAFPTMFGSTYDWGLSTTAQPSLGDRTILFPQGHVLGGSSSINAMMWVRPMAVDLDAWAQAVGPEWGSDAARTYFERIEGATSTDDRPAPAGHGTMGPLAISRQRDPHLLTKAFLDACQAISIPRDDDPNRPMPLGASETIVTQRHARRHSVADAYLKKARNRINLVIRTGALCHKVLIEHGRASGVAYQVGRYQASVAMARREIVLCAGAIGSPAILQRSGIGAKDDLGRAGVEVLVESPEVGHNLTDHLTAGIVVRTKGVSSLARARSPKSVLSYLMRRRGMLTSPICEAYAFLRSDKTLEAPDLEIVFAPVAFVDQGQTVPNFDAVTLAAVLLCPKSRGTVHIESSNPRANPIVNPAYLSDSDGEDARVLAAGVEKCIELANTMPLTQSLGEVALPKGTSGEALRMSELPGAAIKDLAQTLYHPVGTCRMGLDPTSVVDEELAVRGVKCLRVADASVMPTIIRGHTNAPTMMIAEHAVDILRQARSDREGGCGDGPTAT